MLRTRAKDPREQSRATLKETTLKIAARLLGLWMLTGALAAQAQQSDKIGFFVGEATPATAAPAYRSFVSKVQQTPNSTNVFVDYREPIWSPGTYDAKWR